MTDVLAGADDAPGIGHNQPPELIELAKQISGLEDFSPVLEAFLREHYGHFEKDIDAMTAEARALIDDGTGKRIVLGLTDADKEKAGKIAALVKRFRDMSALLNSHREKEKAPYLRGVQTADGLFFAWMERCAKRAKGAKDGVADVLYKIVDDWNKLQLAEEQRRRREEEQRALREAEELQRRADQERQIAESARLAAERARKPETQAAKEEFAATAEEQASTTAAEAAIATDAAVGARLAGLAKPADMTRTRHTSGAMSTTATEKYAEVVDATKLNKELLWPFIPLAAKEQALRAWAKTHGHREKMEGAEIGERPKTQIR